MRALQRVCIVGALGSCVRVHEEDGTRNLQLIEPAWPRPAASQGYAVAVSIYSEYKNCPSFPFFREPTKKCLYSTQIGVPM